MLKLKTWFYSNIRNIELVELIILVFYTFIEGAIVVLL